MFASFRDRLPLPVAAEQRHLDEDQDDRPGGDEELPADRPEVDHQHVAVTASQASAVGIRTFQPKLRMS